MSTALNATVGGLGSVLEGVGAFSKALTGYGDTLEWAGNQMGIGRGPTRNWDINDMKNDPLGYLSDPSGLTYSAFNLVGSMIPSLAVSAATGGIGGAAIGAAGRAAGIGGRVLNTAENVARLAEGVKPLTALDRAASIAGNIAGAAAGGAVDAATEGGQTYQRALEMNYDDDTARNMALQDFGDNIVFSSLQNAISMNAMKRIGNIKNVVSNVGEDVATAGEEVGRGTRLYNAIADYGDKNFGTRLGRNILTTNTLEAYQEGLQQEFQDNALGIAPVHYNPLDMSEDAQSQIAQTFLGMVPSSGLGAVGRSRMKARENGNFGEAPGNGEYASTINNGAYQDTEDSYASGTPQNGFLNNVNNMGTLTNNLTDQYSPENRFNDVPINSNNSLEHVYQFGNSMTNDSSNLNAITSPANNLGLIDRFNQSVALSKMVNDAYKKYSPENDKLVNANDLSVVDNNGNASESTDTATPTTVNNGEIADNTTKSGKVLGNVDNSFIKEMNDVLQQEPDQYHKNESDIYQARRPTTNFDKQQAAADVVINRAQSRGDDLLTKKPEETITGYKARIEKYILDNETNNNGQIPGASTTAKRVADLIGHRGIYQDRHNEAQDLLNRDKLGELDELKPILNGTHVPENRLKEARDIIKNQEDTIAKQQEAKQRREELLKTQQDTATKKENAKKMMPTVMNEINSGKLYLEGIKSSTPKKDVLQALKDHFGEKWFKDNNIDPEDLVEDAKSGLRSERAKREKLAREEKKIADEAKKAADKKKKEAKKATKTTKNTKEDTKVTEDKAEELKRRAEEIGRPEETEEEFIKHHEKIVKREAVKYKITKNRKDALANVKDNDKHPDRVFSTALAERSKGQKYEKDGKDAMTDPSENAPKVLEKIRDLTRSGEMDWKEVTSLFSDKKENVIKAVVDYFNLRQSGEKITKAKINEIVNKIEKPTENGDQDKDAKWDKPIEEAFKETDKKVKEEVQANKDVEKVKSDDGENKLKYIEKNKQKFENIINRLKTKEIGYEDAEKELNKIIGNINRSKYKEESDILDLISKYSKDMKEYKEEAEAEKEADAKAAEKSSGKTKKEENKEPKKFVYSAGSDQQGIQRVVTEETGKVIEVNKGKVVDSNRIDAIVFSGNLVDSISQALKDGNYKEDENGNYVFNGEQKYISSLGLELAEKSKDAKLKERAIEFAKNMKMKFDNLVLSKEIVDKIKGKEENNVESNKEATGGKANVTKESGRSKSVQKSTGKVQKGQDSTTNDTEHQDGQEGQDSVEGSPKSDERLVLNAIQQKAIDKSGLNNMEFFDYSNNPEEFSQLLNEGRKINDHGDWVDPQNAEQLPEKIKGKKGIIVVLKDKLAGFIVTTGGDVEGLFKNPASHEGQVGLKLAFMSRILGGTKMDCYGKYLANLYEVAGFKPVARVRFDPKYVESEKLKEEIPYVYVMMKNSDSNPTVADKLAKHKVKLSTQEELDKLPLFLDYDEAIKARDELLANKTPIVSNITQEQADAMTEIDNASREGAKNGNGLKGKEKNSRKRNNKNGENGRVNSEREQSGINSRGNVESNVKMSPSDEIFQHHGIKEDNTGRYRNSARRNENEEIDDFLKRKNKIFDENEKDNNELYDCCDVGEDLIDDELLTTVKHLKYFVGEDGKVTKESIKSILREIFGSSVGALPKELKKKMKGILKILHPSIIFYRQELDKSVGGYYNDAHNTIAVMLNDILEASYSNDITILHELLHAVLGVHLDGFGGPEETSRKTKRILDVCIKNSIINKLGSDANYESIEDIKKYVNLAIDKILSAKTQEEMFSKEFRKTVYYIDSNPGAIEYFIYKMGRNKELEKIISENDLIAHEVIVSKLLSDLKNCIEDSYNIVAAEYFDETGIDVEGNYLRGNTTFDEVMEMVEDLQDKKEIELYKNTYIPSYINEWTSSMNEIFDIILENKGMINDRRYASEIKQRENGLTDIVSNGTERDFAINHIATEMEEYAQYGNHLELNKKIVELLSNKDKINGSDFDKYLNHLIDSDEQVRLGPKIYDLTKYKDRKDFCLQIINNWKYYVSKGVKSETHKLNLDKMKKIQEKVMKERGPSVKELIKDHLKLSQNISEKPTTTEEASKDLEKAGIKHPDTVAKEAVRFGLMGKGLGVLKEAKDDWKKSGKRLTMLKRLFFDPKHIFEKYIPSAKRIYDLADKARRALEEKVAEYGKDFVTTFGGLTGAQAKGLHDYILKCGEIHRDSLTVASVGSNAYHFVLTQDDYIESFKNRKKADEQLAAIKAQGGYKVVKKYWEDDGNGSGSYTVLASKEAPHVFNSEEEARKFAEDHMMKETVNQLTKDGKISKSDAEVIGKRYELYRKLMDKAWADLVASAKAVGYEKIPKRRNGYYPHMHLPYLVLKRVKNGDKVTWERVESFYNASEAAKKTREMINNGEEAKFMEMSIADRYHAMIDTEASVYTQEELDNLLEGKTISEEAFKEITELLDNDNKELKEKLQPLFGQNIYVTKEDILKFIDKKLRDGSMAKKQAREAGLKNMLNKTSPSNGLGYTYQEIESMINRGNTNPRFAKHLLAQSDKKGYSLNVPDAVYRYLIDVANYTAKAEFQNKADKVYHATFGTDRRKEAPKTEEAKFVSEYITANLGVRNITAFDNMINEAINSIPGLGYIIRKYYSPNAYTDTAGKILGLQNVLKLGMFNPSAFLVQSSQLLNANAKLAGNGKLGKIFGFSKEFKYGIKMAYGNGKKADAKYKELFDFIGLDNKRFALDSELLGKAPSLSERRIYDDVTFGKMMDKSMLFFEQGDTRARKASAIASYEKALKEGKSKEEAKEIAKSFVTETNFDYSVVNTPLGLTKLGVTGKILLQFKKYPLFTLNFLAHSTGAERIRFIVPLVLLAGCFGVPCGDLFDEASQKITGRSPKLFLKKNIMEWAGNDPTKKAIANVAMYGAPSLAGINLSNRVGLNDAISLDAGPTISTVQNLYKAIFDSRDAEGMATASMKAISPMAGNIASAIGGKYENSRGETVTEYNMWQRAMKGVGFKPVEESQASDAKQVMTYMRKKYTQAVSEAKVDYRKDPSTGNYQALKIYGLSDKDIAKVLTESKETVLEKSKKQVPNSKNNSTAATDLRDTYKAVSDFTK